jgi:hypothetical protein
MKAVNIPSLPPTIVAGALLCWSRAGPKGGSRTENAIRFYMYAILDM